MRRGLVGPFQEGTLSGMSEILKIAAEITNEPAANLENIFYTSAFQAGVDGFIIYDLESNTRPISQFLTKRTTVVSKEKYRERWNVISAAFSKYLPDDWQQNDKYAFAWRCRSFVIDLLDAMSEGASLLSPTGIPGIAEANARLPSELAVPITNLISSFDDYQTVSIVPQKFVPSEDLQRFNDIITSDLFARYVSAQSELDNQDASISNSFLNINSLCRDVFIKNSKLLTLRKSSLSILRVSPKLIDAAFGKLPGRLSEVAANIGIDFLQAKRRVVVYDFESPLFEILVTNLTRMLRAAEDKKKGS